MSKTIYLKLDHSRNDGPILVPFNSAEELDEWQRKIPSRLGYYPETISESIAATVTKSVIVAKEDLPNIFQGLR